MSRRARLVDFGWSCRRNHVMGNPDEHKPIRTHPPLSVRNTKQFGHIHRRFGYQMPKRYQLVCRARLEEFKQALIHKLHHLGIYSESHQLHEHP